MPLMIIHAQLAARFHDERWLISKEECDKLSQAAANLASVYDVGMTKKQKAWSAFIASAGSVYGMRVMDTVMRPKTPPARPVVMHAATPVARPGPMPSAPPQPQSPAPNDGFIQ